MKIIISPAKKMNIDDDIFECRSEPVFLNKAEELMNYLKGLSYEECKTMWKCSDKLAQLNYDRVLDMDLNYRLTPAIFSYEGIQYQYMGPSVLSQDAIEYLQSNLRILSGFYGILKPLDGIVPYRLEMQAKLINHKNKDLYEFWSDNIANNLFEEDDVDTIAGLVVKLLGRIAQVGDTVSFNGLTFTVKEVDGARITKLQIYKEPVEENEDTEEA